MLRFLKDFCHKKETSQWGFWFDLVVLFSIVLFMVFVMIVFQPN